MSVADEVWHVCWCDWCRVRRTKAEGFEAKAAQYGFKGELGQIAARYYLHLAGKERTMMHHPDPEDWR